MSVNKRGPYKQYIYEEHNPEIPASTAHSRKKRHDHSQENLGSVENIKCSKLSRIEEINVAGSSNEVAIIPIVSSEKDSGSEGLQSSDGEVDDISSCLSHDEGDDSLLCTDNSSEYEIDLASDMEEYEEIPIADEDHNNVIDNAEDHNQNPHMEQFRQVLYEGCNLSKEESKMLLVSLALRHQLTDVALESLVQVIDCHLPRTHHGSKYLLLKSLPESKACKYYYCPECYTILNSCIDNRMKCEVCTTIYKKKYLDKKNNYFIHIPLKEQLIELVKSEDFAQFRKTKEMESDIINGNVYRNLRSKNIIGDNDITLQWNSDGVQLFKSSMSSIWPILVTINELPYRLRRQHILLAGI
ncbi:uncharacterized protein LOC143897709 [Temnothorax americanus]|uniref:uncharacterized protein LOC143897709 n=1 Tax=Temnothorax americanus TaxID=1964332 RepID=UPI004068BEF0